MSIEFALKSRWEELTSGLPAETASKWWDIISESYQKSDRHYHNLHHLDDMFTHFDANRSLLKSPDMVAYSIFFHDLVYDPKTPNKNEDESVTLFGKFVGDVGICKGSALYEETVRLISLTKTHLTEEHKLTDVHGHEDHHYFMDFDLAILGSPADGYDEYASKIRREYEFMAEPTYNVLRAKILKSFLQIPNIFATESFRKNYESKARSNIQREIETLEGKSG